ncbi:MAG TPA: enoyl-CoA hydratase-related protein [Phenylobacterium sp.]|uniref:enoyl-CoA hydratase/isomerase family protein n=1 Tax=Phenylobacterium sp. TaxID=1871053 RepID=UPI002B472F0E|nr:enoyl-CoA hydratase-related protein [Phenylobacterium sp.]HKR86843.1 enoyl-CoA hydratase-related protein [Phenylobacterium sp.]
MTPDQESLLTERRGDGVVLLTLNRPDQRNALATPLLEAVAAQLQGADLAPDVRAVVITGNPKVFAAGADLDELARSDGSEPVESPRTRAWRAISDFRKPLIAAVEGWCLGAGSELMLRCDVVVAGRGAKIGLPETNLGIIPGAGGTAILPRMIGRAAAMEMILTGEPISGERAYQLGLIARVVDDGEALAAASSLAAKLAARAPRALAAAKASVHESLRRPLEEHLRFERELFLSLLGGEEKQEGIAAFRQKRAPVWPQG